MDTSWHVTNLPNASEAFVLQDGAELQVEVTGPTSIWVRTTVDDHRYQIFTGYHGQPTAAREKPTAATMAGGATFAARTRTAAANAEAAQSVMLSGSAGCPCCTSSA